MEIKQSGKRKISIKNKASEDQRLLPFCDPYGTFFEPFIGGFKCFSLKLCQYIILIIAMPFFEIGYNPEQQELFDYFDRIGVVLETVIMTSSEPKEDIHQYSKHAAIKGMEVLADRHAKWFQKTNPELNIEDYFRIIVLAGEELKGKEITFTDFMGNRFDLQTGTLKLLDRLTDEIYDGLTYALLNPPYGLKVDRKGNFASEEYLKTENKSYSKILTTYLKTILNISDHKNTAHLKFISWSDNWSNYFDAGKEWWGTFCWTIYNFENNTITFIAASSTD